MVLSLGQSEDTHGIKVPVSARFQPALGSLALLKRLRLCEPFGEPNIMREKKKRLCYRQ